MPPTVSIIVPCYNEQTGIGSLLDAIMRQTYPRQQMDVVIADGMSGDNSRGIIARFRELHPELRVQVVDNLRRTIPTGLNLAAACARGDVIVRLDAHSVPVPEYVERCVNALERGRGAVVGGIWLIRAGGEGLIASGIAEAAGHPLGVGDAMYRLRTGSGPVDTVPFGAFRRSLFVAMGGFDESLLTNEDYEFNTRIRKKGGVVWLDPEIRSTYVARATLLGLARQYWRYGYWKLRMLRRHPASVRWRQVLPPAFVTSLITLGLLSVFLPLARFLLLVEFVLYSLTLAFAGVALASRRRKASLVLGLPLAIATMHVAWGMGFMWSLFLSVLPGSHG